MRVLKFGGTSLASAERIAAVVQIVAKARQRSSLVVVVSAAGGVTNDLETASRQAAARDAGYEETWSRIAQRHRQLVAAVAAPDEASDLADAITARFEDLRDLLHGVYLLRGCGARTRDSILAYGERISAVVVAAALRRHGLPARSVDARELIVTDNAFGRARAMSKLSYPRLAEELAAGDSVPVVTGFIAATEAGETTTLGRGGSDLTAALVASALDADAIELWTDVAGVMSADPRLVRDAFPLPRLSYSELVELSHFGAKVVFSTAVHPAREKGIPLLIKSTLDPSAAGTRVEGGRAANPYAVRGISSIHDITLIGILVT